MNSPCITAIQGSVGPDDWRATISRARTPPAVTGYRKLYYPYDWTLFRYRTRTWLGRTALKVSCLVDRRTRVCSTADPFPTADVVPGDALVLNPRISRNTATALARRYAAHAVRQKHKAFVLPRVEVVERQSVYKPFWVVDCRPQNGRPQTLLFDGVTGAYCALARGAATLAAQRVPTTNV